MDPIFPSVPEDFAALSEDELSAFIAESEQAIAEVSEAPQSFVNEARTSETLLSEMEAGIEALESARVELAVREVEEPEDVASVEDDEEFAASVAALAARAQADEPEPAEEPEEPVEEPESEAAAVVEPLVAAVPVARPRPPRPARSRQAAPQNSERALSLTAAAGGLGHDMGSEIDPYAAAEMMTRRREQFGLIAEGSRGEKIPIARASWKDFYPSERYLGKDEVQNEALIAAAINPRAIREEFDRRRRGSLTASGGLCAPVTPYYQLQQISAADRPVRAALAAFNADRGGVRFAAPASLAAVTTAVGSISAAEDAAGGSSATKTCQVVACPAFSEVDVETIFHCVQFGNLGARTFPERVAQWNELVLAAHARSAESALLTGIDTASTQVTAASLGLGATGALLGQILAAAKGMRSRHRMNPEAVLRLLLPSWALGLLVSDVIRSQFERFDTDEAKITALLRSFDVEPSFYLDGASGAGQVFGTQAEGALLPFPATVEWYLYPEGSFLFVDGGTLELGLVRDSVLNATNDYQIFGETFENVAFIGVESLAVTSTVCDSGTVSNPHDVDCPVNYAHSS